MKNRWFIFVTALFLAACSGSPKQDTAGDDLPDSTGNQWVEVTMEVEGMTCEGCEKAINANLESLEGVASSQSSHLEKQTTVRYDPEVVTLDELEEKITATGYTVKGVKEGTTP